MDNNSEIVDITDSLALIEIRGGGFDSLLLVDGEPIALNWSDCEGSVGQYLARAGATSYEESLQSLRHFLSGKFLSDVPLGVQLSSFLDLFVSGRYRLQRLNECEDCDYLEYHSDWTRTKNHDEFYPFGWSLIMTQPRESLNHEQVQRYIEDIKKGVRPIALTATVEEGWCDFVIDGHHKLQAYKLAQIAPTFISVCRLDAPQLSSSSFDQSIDPNHPMSSHYRKVKTEHNS